MKLSLILAFGVLSLGFSAKADVVCEAVKRTAGKHVIRGIKVKFDTLNYEKTSWFGTNSEFRDRAGRACWEVVNATSCSGITPRVSDRYMNVGDPGFGPRLYVEKSTKAGLLSLQWVPSDVLRYYPSDYSSLNGKYFAFFSHCEEARAELANEVVRNFQTEFLSLAREKFLKEHPEEIGSDWRFAP